MFLAMNIMIARMSSGGLKYWTLGHVAEGVVEYWLRVERIISLIFAVNSGSLLTLK